MKVKGARLVKQIISVVSCVTKGKCTAAIRTKTDAMKARIIVTVLSKKKTISAKINDAIDVIFNQHSRKDEEVSKAIVLYSSNKADSGSEAETSNCSRVQYYDQDDKYPDLTHTLFDEEDEEIAYLLDDPNSSMSAIDIVKNSKENGEKFNLEDQIDEVADLFITQFHKRMRLQKILSFKRYQQMNLERRA